MTTTFSKRRRSSPTITEWLGLVFRATLANSDGSSYCLASGQSLFSQPFWTHPDNASTKETQATVFRQGLQIIGEMFRITRTVKTLSLDSKYSLWCIGFSSLSAKFDILNPLPPTTRDVISRCTQQKYLDPVLFLRKNLSFTAKNNT